ncbi:MAG: hypothetical protein IJX24_07705 [Oscillospiraceae bacterium]|nr:hypothetical protein [Oscillospiraceae bacterium]
MKKIKILTILSACSALLLYSFTVNAAGELPTKAYICGEIGSSAVWDAENTTIGSTVAEINGDAQYEVEWKVTDDGGATELTFLALSIPNITADSYPDINVNVTSVYVDGVSVNYQMSPNAINTAYYEAGRDPETRVYLYDGLNGTNVADLPKNTQIKDSIKIIFTVTGTGQYGTSNIEENIIETTAVTDTSESSEVTAATTVAATDVESTTTGAAGNSAVAIAATAGLVLTAGTALLSKVKIKKK